MIGLPTQRYDVQGAQRPPPIPTWQKIALTLDEAAAMIGVSRGHLEKFVANGELPVVHLGKSVRVIPATLTQFIVDHEGGTA